MAGLAILVLLCASLPYMSIVAEHVVKADARADEHLLHARQLAQGGKIQAVGHACVEEAHDEQADPAARVERPQRYAAGRGDVGNENDDGG